MVSLPDIIFKGGDEELREFPQNLREQLLDHLVKSGRTEPDWGVVSSASRDNLFQDDEGRPAHFEVLGSRERLLAARFSYGKGRITVVKEKQGHIINAGNPSLLAFGRNVARKVVIDNVEYSTTKYHVWHSDHDTRERGFAQAEVARYVCTDDDYILSQTQNQTQARVQALSPALTDPTSARTRTPTFPILSVADFIHKEGDIVTFPAHLVDEINGFCGSAIDLPSCMRDPNSKSILSREGRQAVFIISDTKQELSIGRFRELRNKPGKDYIVVRAKDGTGFNNGQAMLIGEICGQNINLKSQMHNGKEYNASKYHLWTPKRDKEHLARTCQATAVLKLLERVPKHIDSDAASKTTSGITTSPAHRPRLSDEQRLSYREVVGLRSYNEPGLGENDDEAEASRRRAAARPVSYVPEIVDLDDYDYDEDANLAAWTGVKRRASSVSQRSEHTIDSEESIEPEPKRQKSTTAATSVTPSKSPYTTRVSNGDVSNRIQKMYAEAPIPSVEWPDDEDTRMDLDLDGHAPGCPALGGTHRICQCNRPCSHHCRNKATCAHPCCQRSAKLLENKTIYETPQTQPTRTQQGFLNTQDELNLPSSLREPRLPIVEQAMPPPSYVLPARTPPKANTSMMQHTFSFKPSSTSVTLRQKTAKMCNTVVQLFGHAKVAGIADNDAAILICQHKSNTFHIVRGDTEDFDAFFESLKEFLEPQEIIVLPDTPDKRDVKKENEQLRTENANLKEELAAKVKQIQQQKEQFKAAIEAMS